MERYEDEHAVALVKCLTFEEIEALLAAERERCAKVAETVFSWSPAWTGPVHMTIAEGIRNLPPQTERGQP